MAWLENNNVDPREYLGGTKALGLFSSPKPSDGGHAQSHPPKNSSTIRKAIALSRLPEAPNLAVDPYAAPESLIPPALLL